MFTWLTKRGRIAFVTFAMLLAATAVARADKTDDYINGRLKGWNIPGLSLVVVKEGEIIKAAGYGLANVSLKIPATPETVYHIGSISKPFVAMGIMLLVQEGRLGLDDSISKHLEGLPATWKAITVRHLLTHTSGIVREEPGFDPFKVQNMADVIKSAYRVPLRFAPGDKWEYANAGYSQLAEIIRVVTGQPWSDYLSEKIFRPAGMNSTYPTNTKERIPNRARGYNDEAQEVDDWRTFYPAGGFLSTAPDLAKWDAVLNTDKLLSDTNRRQMWTPVTLNAGTTHPYGLGWELDGPVSGDKVVRHGGSVRGFRAEFARFTDERLTIIILMNANDIDYASVVRGVAAQYLPAPPANSK
jgi:D-alanyl-D-alanine carboxypeptidase